MNSQAEVTTLNSESAKDSRWLALYILCTGMLMIVVDATVVNVALPNIKDDLGFSQSNLAWVVNGYLIAFGGLLLLAGRMGDLLGQRRIFLLGLVVFTGASLLCGVAQSQAWLIAARFIQGVGGAMTSAVILGMIVTMFPERGEQAKAIGVFGFVASGGGSLGLVLGGVITDTISWHWIFFINLPIGILTALLALRYVEDRPGIGFGEGADIPGAVLLTGGLMTGTYAILGVSEHGWTGTQTLVLNTVSLLLITAFVVRQSRISNPLMPLRLFRSRNVSGANVVQALMVAGMFGMFFLGALYMQEVLGYNPLEVGLAFLPATLVMGLMSLKVSDRLAMRYGPKNVLMPSMAAIAGGLLLFAIAPVDAEYAVNVAPATVLIGLGAGLGFPALMTLAMSGATMEDSGLASGLVNTSLQVGGAIGLAVLATLSEDRTSKLLDEGVVSHASALTSGYHLAFVVGFGLIVLAAVIGAVVLKNELPAMMTEGAGSDEAATPEPAYEAA